MIRPVTVTKLRELALSFPESTEEPHFEKTSFRVRKKIFATYDDVHRRASLKLSVSDQDVFSSADPAVIYPVPNKWGQQGWTLVELDAVDEQVFAAALTSAYCTVAPKELGDAVRPYP